MRRLIQRLFFWLFLPGILLLVLLLSPIVHVETFCRADVEQESYAPTITDSAFQRAEANTYLTYPEWHIVYAYEGLARTLSTGDEHGFGYISSVMGFWSSFCALNRRANRHGGGDFATRATVHTIGVSFTLEMAAKALYEETLGRLFAIIRGSEKTPQDDYAAGMAADYAAFLQQVPWYEYDFDRATAELWDQPMPSLLRGWERRLALGAEWKAKAAYAGVIAEAVAAVGPAQLRIRSIVQGLPRERLAAIGDVNIIDADTGANQVIIETPRYRKFTEILRAIAAAGGTVVEIAGNDDIMASLVEPPDAAPDALVHAVTIIRIGRDGYDGRRLLVSAKVRDLAALIEDIDAGELELEHIYDY